MDHAHDHTGHAHDHGIAHAPEHALRWALVLTGGFTLAEAAGAWLTQSLALLSDAAHMFTDTAALVIALVAIRLGKRSADARRTFGYARFEILAAAFNASVLFLVALYILSEAVGRLRNPATVAATPMMLLAALGLAVNLAAMRLLRGASTSSLNVHGAYLEVWSDMLGSLGVLIAGATIVWTGWTPIDPIVAVAISLWILPRTWGLLKESIHILLEGVPTGIDIAAVAAAVRAVAGVAGVHDLHVWSVTSGQVMLTAHIERDLAAEASDSATLAAVRELIEQRFGIVHTTLQLEHGVCEIECVLTDARAGESARKLV
jgi:cobalt-zinc-cadmium efflux system protein